MNILVLNAGSSSQKISLYDLPNSLPSGALPDARFNEPPPPRWQGAIDFGHSEGQAEIKVKTHSGQTLTETVPSRDRTAAIQHLLNTLWQGATQVITNPSEVHAIGHRVVHGGQAYCQATRIDETVKATIERLIPLAPVHNRANLAGIEIAQSIFGSKTPQFAVFDTAFHSTLPNTAALYPVPQSWIAHGIRRYGFHGISHQYCANRAAQLLGQPLPKLRLIICHLGNGCSLSAVQNGRSIDTTMGFTPLDGLMMGTRSGSVDPGILTYLMRSQNYTHAQLDQQLNQASGLKGVSTLSGDMREIVLAMNTGHAKAKLAFDMYIHRLRQGIAAMAASLNGFDALVFTAGVGENSAIVRTEVCKGLRFLGVMISVEKNTAASDTSPTAMWGDRILSDQQSTLPILVIHTQEDWQIAQECWSLQHLPN